MLGQDKHLQGDNAGVRARVQMTAESMSAGIGGERNARPQWCQSRFREDKHLQGVSVDFVNQHKNFRLCCSKSLKSLTRLQTTRGVILHDDVQHISAAAFHCQRRYNQTADLASSVVTSHSIILKMFGFVLVES